MPWAPSAPSCGRAATRQASWSCSRRPIRNGPREMAGRLGDTGWRELLERHHAIVRRELARFRGRELDTAGDGFFASFDGPARAVEAAAARREALPEVGLGSPGRLAHGRVA